MFNGKDENILQYLKPLVMSNYNNNNSVILYLPQRDFTL